MAKHRIHSFFAAVLTRKFFKMQNVKIVNIYLITK